MMLLECCSFLLASQFVRYPACPFGRVVERSDVGSKLEGFSCKVGFPPIYADAMVVMRMTLLDEIGRVGVTLDMAPPAASVGVLAATRLPRGATDNFKPSAGVHNPN